MTTRELLKALQSVPTEMQDWELRFYAEGELDTGEDMSVWGDFDDFQINGAGPRVICDVSKAEVYSYEEDES